MCLTTQFHLDEKSAIRRSETRTTVPETVVGTSMLSTPNRRLGFIKRRKPIGTLSLLFRYGKIRGLWACAATFLYIVPLPNIFLTGLFSKTRFKRKDLHEIVRLSW